MEPITRIARFFETLAPADLARLVDIYTEDAAFTDPFSHVHGLPAIRRVYEHMFETLQAPRFAVQQCIGTGPDHVVLWDFRFGLRGGRAGCIAGASLLRLAPDGRIALHRDYWDAAELYAQMPVLGRAVRWLKRRSAPPAATR